jgi:pilus assembly protein CpaE
MNFVGIMDDSTMTGRNWAVHAEDGSARVVLSEGEMAGAAIVAGEVAGFGVVMHMLDADVAVPEDVIAMARVLIVEVRPDSEASLRRLLSLKADHPRLPVVAAVRDASIPVVRTLIKAGVNDVVALPLGQADLAATLQRIRDELLLTQQVDQKTGKIISIVRSVGGAGATTLATQAACLQALRDAEHGGQTCLFDLDLQFGNAATYLGVSPKLTIAELLEAGSRVDTAMLRSVTAPAGNGLQVIAAPTDIIPLESVSPDQIYHLVDLAAREFDTVFLDLPGSWTNWSLSLAARSDVVILVVELTVASLRQARRQLALFAHQGISTVPTIVVANRVQKKMFRSIDLGDAEKAIGHPVAFGISNDFPLVSTAHDQGVMIGEIKAKSKVAKDIDALLDGCGELMARVR